MMLFSGTIHPALGREIADNLGIPVSQQRAPAVRVGRDLLPGRGERPRRRRVRRAVALRAGERGDDGAADHDRRDEARVRQADQRRDPVLRLLAAGPQGALPRADQRQARGRPALDGRARTGSISVDLHSGQIQGYFDFPFDHLTALPILSDYFKDELGLHGDNLVVVAPDAGRIKTSEKLREYLHADLAFLYKRRSRKEAHKIEEMAVVGEVEGRPCVIVDDMIDTAATISKGVQVLAEMGAGPIFVGATHGAVQRQGSPAPRGSADRAGRRHEHGADPRGADVREAEGAVDRAADRERPSRRVRGLVRLRDLRRATTRSRPPGALAPGGPRAFAARRANHGTRGRARSPAPPRVGRS